MSQDFFLYGSQFEESVCFNMHIYPKPQIYIGLGEKNKLKCWEEMDLLC